VNGLEAVEANARLAVEKLGQLTDFEFGFDRRSVEWVEGFIERQRMREDFDPEGLGALPGVLGCFLGQAIIAQVGGTVWASNDDYGSWAVRLANGSELFPVTKVYKRFMDGPEDSILSFYDIAVDYIATGRFDNDRGRNDPPPPPG